jgi:hypothetical protein
MPVSLCIAWLLVVALLSARYVRRRRVTRADGIFRCRVRLSAGRCAHWPRLRHRWSRRRFWARWVGCELVVWRGPLVLRSVRLPGRVRVDGAYRVTARAVKGCGYRPLAVELEFPDGSRIQIAAEDRDRIELVGPYLAAAMHHLPRSPRRRRIPGSDP